MMNKKLARAALGLLAMALAPAASAQSNAPSTIPPGIDFSKMFVTIPANDMPGAIPLRPAVPGAPPEQWELMTIGANSAPNVRNVVNPTLTPVLPAPGKANGAAVIVAPGGGFRGLAIDHEGFAVARWLAARGIAAFVLKYRVIPTPRNSAARIERMMADLGSRQPDNSFRDPTPEALEDALAAIRLVRQRSAEWGVAADKVGFVGFSAGAVATLGAGLAADPAARPDFIAPIYPTLVARAVPADAPPMFLAISLDDPLFGQGKPLGLIQSWRDARRPVEVHLYEKGGHGFGMSGRSNGPALWINSFYAWMKDRTIIPAGR